MKILIFNWRDISHPWAGGAEVFLQQVARRWVQRGHQVTWFCGRYKGCTAYEQADGIEIVRRGGFYSVYPNAAWYYLCQQRGRFDVILDNANGIPFFTPLFSSIPKVIMVHHIHYEVFFHELPYHLAHLANFLERYAMPFLYRRVPFATVSPSSRQALIRIGVRPAQISMLYNAVDHDRYHPGPKSERPFLLYVGRLRHYKSVDVAVRALPEVLSVLPDLRFHIVGMGVADRDLHDLVQTLGLSKAVQFHGYVSEERKIELMQQAHLVVNTSLKEGWGLTVLEANACGTPVIGTDVPGLRDSIRHDETGMLVPYGDPHALAVGICELLHNHSRREQLAQNALAWAARFDWDSTAQQGLALLERCCTGGKHL